MVLKADLSCTESFVFYMCNACNYLLMAIFILPLIFCFFCRCCYLNYPMKAYVYTAFGRVRFVEKKETHPGIRFRCCFCCLERREVNLRLQTKTARGSSVPDSTGSPLNVSSMISFVVVDPIAALYSVENLDSYIENQMFEVMRRVCSKFKYKSTDPSDLTLIEDSHLVAKGMCDLLKKKTAIAGVNILMMDFVELSISSEMAVQLLQVQRAEARIDARKKIVEGAVGITAEALSLLQESGLDLDERHQADLAKSLMSLTCSDDGNV